MGSLQCGGIPLISSAPSCSGSATLFRYNLFLGFRELLTCIGFAVLLLRVPRDEILFHLGSGQKAEMCYATCIKSLPFGRNCSSLHSTTALGNIFHSSVVVLDVALIFSVSSVFDNMPVITPLSFMLLIVLIRFLYFPRSACDRNSMTGLSVWGFQLQPIHFFTWMVSFCSAAPGRNKTAYLPSVDWTLWRDVWQCYCLLKKHRSKLFLL